MPSVAGAMAAVISPGAALEDRERHDLRQWRVHALLVGAVLCVAAIALSTLSAPPAPRSRALASRHSLRGHPNVPIALAAVASARIGASEQRFSPVRRGDSLLTQGGGIQSSFTASGARLRVALGTLGLSLVGVGRGHLDAPVTAVSPMRAGSRVLYRHGSLSEFYGNGPYGLEQGFTLRHRSLPATGSLVLALRVRGSLVPKQVGSQILFRTHAGVTALSYGQLSAVDAIGRRLPALMQVRNGSLQLWIDDSRARYPLRIDPFIQQGSKLTAKEETENGRFGYSAVLSSDGKTALIGGYGDSGEVGAAWVFTRSGSAWTQQAKLTGKEETGNGQFGFSVALSSDGNTALIGGPHDNSEHGAAWVFTRSGAVWSQQGSKLSAEESGIFGAQFGDRVALSSEGNTALIGGGADGEQAGAAWVFTRAGSAWTQQAKLTPKKGEESGEGHFGFSVALSSDGNTALIGGPGDNAGIGAAWVFTRSGGVWTQQGSKLTGSEEKGDFGESVALSSDGSTALIGADLDNTFQGTAWVFTRSEGVWTQQAKLAGNEETGNGQFGFSVALSGDGNTALIGGQHDNGNVGAAWVFTRSMVGAWTQLGPKLTGKEESGNSQFGFSVALSADGGTALIGGPEDAGKLGAAWAFERTPGYTYNGVPAGKAITVILWGTVTLKTVLGGSGEVTCHTVGAGTVENPPGGGAGAGLTQVFATFDCEQAGMCTSGETVAVVAESLPWQSALEAEPSVIRDKTTGVKEKIGCFAGGKEVAGTTFLGSLRPNFKHGTSALHPGFLEYDAGENKILGYAEQELINVKR
jgi:hypothetical protein